MRVFWDCALNDDGVCVCDVLVAADGVSDRQLLESPLPVLMAQLRTYGANIVDDISTTYDSNQGKACVAAVGGTDVYGVLVQGWPEERDAHYRG